jgi:hypothetical protein
MPVRVCGRSLAHINAFALVKEGTTCTTSGGAEARGERVLKKALSGSARGHLP